jgi:hypothetical protein
VNDRLVEVTTESFAGQALAITSSGGATVTANGSRTIEVTENDSAVVDIGTGSTTVSEAGGSENVVATLDLVTDGTGTEELAVDISANLPGNADYASIAASFASGSVDGATANVVVSAVNDAIVEGPQVFTGEALTITSTGGANVTPAGTRDITVVDNDTAAITFATSSSSSGEGTTALVGVTLTITADGVGTPTLGADVTVDLSAPAGSDSDITLPGTPAVTRRWHWGCHPKRLCGNRRRPAGRGQRIVRSDLHQPRRSDRASDGRRYAYAHRD